MKDNSYAILKIGKMYLDYINCDDYDVELQIRFTTDINEAKKLYYEDNIIWISEIIQNMINIEPFVLYCNEKGIDKDD